MALSKEDIATISRTVVETLDSRRTVPEEQHHEDHDWLTRFREKADERATMWKTIKVRAIGWAVVATITAIATGIVWLVKQAYAIGHDKIGGG